MFNRSKIRYACYRRQKNTQAESHLALIEEVEKVLLPRRLVYRDLPPLRECSDARLRRSDLLRLGKIHVPTNGLSPNLPGGAAARAHCRRVRTAGPRRRAAATAAARRRPGDFAVAKRRRQQTAPSEFAFHYLWGDNASERKETVSHVKRASEGEGARARGREGEA